MPNPELMQIDLLFQNIYSALAQADSTVQLWTSFTFAVIVAAHLGADRIRRGTFKLIVFLYGLYSLVAFVKYAAAAYQILLYQDLLVARNFEQWPVSTTVGAFIGAGTFSLMLAGTIGTLWFLNASINSPNSNE